MIDVTREVLEWVEEERHRLDGPLIVIYETETGGEAYTNEKPETMALEEVLIDGRVNLATLIERFKSIIAIAKSEK